MQMKIMTLAIAMVAAIGASSGAMAAPLDTFAGSVSFSDTSPLLNNPVYFTGNFASPTFNFAPTALNQTYTDQLTVLASDSDLRDQTFTDNVAVSLSFTLPNALNASLGGTGSLSDNYVFIGYLDDGSINFGSPDTISFADGSKLVASLSSISLSGFDGGASGTGDLSLKFETAPTPVPEPTTLALFGMGLFGLGFVARRSKLI